MQELEKVKEDSNFKADIADDAELLQDELIRLFNLYMSEVLDVLSSRFPHTRNDKSVNECEFQGLRAKVLRCGNNKIRLLPEIIKDYTVAKTSQTFVHKVDINTPVSIR